MREKEGERDRVLVVFVQVFPIPVKRMSAVSGVGACFGYPSSDSIVFIRSLSRIARQLLGFRFGGTEKSCCRIMYSCVQRHWTCPTDIDDRNHCIQVLWGSCPEHPTRMSP